MCIKIVDEIVSTNMNKGSLLNCLFIVYFLERIFITIDKFNAFFIHFCAVSNIDSTQTITCNEG